MSLKKQECFKYPNRDKIEEIKKTISWAKNTLSRIKNRKILISMIKLCCYHFKTVCHNQKMVWGELHGDHKAKICKRKMKNNRAIIKTYH